MIDSARARRLYRSTLRLARTRYPAFLFGGRLRAEEIPVFTYHDVEADDLRGDLDFLARNGYRTVGLDEFHDLRCAGARGERAVLLTFDDARRSFWDVAFPVLRERGACAALFVPSYWVGRPGFMTWPQLAECQASGCVDVESHAHRHVLVATSERLVGFASPGALTSYDLFDWPMRCEPGRQTIGRPAPGTPVYESRPLLSARSCVLDPPDAAAACRSVVAEAGGPALFFRRPDADQVLRAAYVSAVAHGGGSIPLSSRELDREVEREIGGAFESFEQRLGRPARFFAYPWMLGTRRSQELLAESGIEAAFGVALDFRRARRDRKSPLRVYGRYKSDWLRFLPGDGRRRLHDVLPAKVAGFLKTQHLAH